eukprot:scaffold61825_cov29-Attheya_sp.AAC.1
MARVFGVREWPLPPLGGEPRPPRPVWESAREVRLLLVEPGGCDERERDEFEMDVDAVVEESDIWSED